MNQVVSSNPIAGQALHEFAAGEPAQGNVLVRDLRTRIGNRNRYESVIGKNRAWKAAVCAVYAFAT